MVLKNILFLKQLDLKILYICFLLRHCKTFFNHDYYHVWCNYLHNKLINCFLRFNLNESLLLVVRTNVNDLYIL